MSSKIYVVDGALLKCNQGFKPAKLLVTQNQKIKIQGKFIATDADNQVPETFGQCKLKPTSGGYLPCMPALQKWTKTTKKATLGKSKKFLYDCSETMCTTGGKITVVQHGQVNTMGSMKEEFKNLAMMIPGAMLGADKAPKVIQSYWMDEEEKEQIETSDYAKKPKFFVMTENIDTSKNLTIEIEDEDNQDFKVGEKMLTYTGTVKPDGSAVLTSIEIKDEWQDTEDKIMSRTLVVKRIKAAGRTFEVHKELRIISKKKCIIKFIADGKDIKNGIFGFDQIPKDYDKKCTSDITKLEEEYTPITVEGEKYFVPWVSMRKDQTITLKLDKDIDKKDEYESIAFEEHSDFTIVPTDKKGNKVDLKEAKKVKITCNNTNQNTTQIKILADGKEAGAINFFYPKPKTIDLKWYFVEITGGKVDYDKLDKEINKAKLESLLKKRLKSCIDRYYY